MPRVHVSQQTIPTLSYGAEIEKVFSAATGEPYAVDNDYFETLGEISGVRENVEPKFETTDDGRKIGILNAIGVESLDNSFVLGESSVWPAVSHEEGGLQRLYEVTRQQLEDVSEALARRGAGVLNMSNHPLMEINPENYRKYVAPKPVYQYLRDERGWDHTAGINAKAQNSPSVGVAPEHAVDALNCSLAIAAVGIALYANSPFDQAKLAGKKESRLAIWKTMFANNQFAGDRRTSQMPEQPFQNMRDYFTWMFDEDTAMYFLVATKEGRPLTKEKGQDVAFFMVDEQPSLLDYMQANEWDATEFQSGRKLKIVPHMGHFALHQFTHFAGARIRFGINEDMSVGDFNTAMGAKGDEVEELFAEHGNYFYIEEREPGANFPDNEICMLGEGIAESVVISPAALYAGFIRNIADAKGLISRYGWSTLRDLREKAIVDGLDATSGDVKLKTLCGAVLEIAAQGLEPSERWMLAYPEFVLRTGQSGADRALERYHKLSGSPASRIGRIAQERIMVLP